MGKVYNDNISHLLTWSFSHLVRLAAIQETKDKPLGTRVGRDFAYPGYHRVALH
jgi:hypothetical protein